MARALILAASLAMALAAPGAGLADPWKDESGHGRAWEGRGEHRDDRRERREWRDRRDHPRDAHRGEYREGWSAPWPPYYAQPRIPPGHLPPPSEGRVWYPDLPPGQQPPPFRY